MKSSVTTPLCFHWKQYSYEEKAKMKTLEEIKRGNRYVADTSHTEEHRIDDYEAAKEVKEE